jgi:hypothetical protein
MPDNLAHAQYDNNGIQIDDPQILTRAVVFSTEYPQSAADVTKAAQGALSSGRSIRFSGKGTILVNNTLYLADNTGVWIDPECTVKMADGSNRTLVFANAAPLTGNSNLYVGGGGTIDCNWQGGAGISDIRQMGIYMCNVNRVTIENLRILNARKYHVHFASAQNYIARNLYIFSTPIGADGVHVHGNSYHGLIVKDVSNWLNPDNPALHIGPIKNLTIRKITGTTQVGQGGNCVAFYSNVTGTGINVTGATWANGIVTVTLASAPTTSAGEFAQIAGVTPTTFNGRFRLLSVAGSTVTYEMETTPGAYTSGGTLDTNYAITGIRIEDIKPNVLNGGSAVYLATFPSPGSGGVIDDVIVDDVFPTGNFGRVVALYTSIGVGSFSKLRHLSVGGLQELIFAEPGFNHEKLIFHDVSNGNYFVSVSGAICRFNSPARYIQVVNSAILIESGATAGWFFTNQSSSTALNFDVIEMTNIKVAGKTTSLGNSGIEFGASNFPSVSLNNLDISNCNAPIKGNGSSGDINLVISGIQTRNVAGGGSVLTFYANGKVLQVAATGYVPRQSSFGAYTFLSNSGTGGAITMLKAFGYPNYTATLNWIASSTPGAGSSLYCDGHEINVDVTKIQRWDGAIVRNTNAAAGTLGVAGLVSCQGTAANSWSLLSDPTKKY